MRSRLGGAYAATLALLLLACGLLAPAAERVQAARAPAGAALPGDAARGRQLFLREGCYTCHGTLGAGAITGPRLAPGPIPWTAFLYQLRHPRGTPPYQNIRMPEFGPRVLTDAQAADVYAYLVSIAPGPPAAKIPLLNER